MQPKRTKEIKMKKAKKIIVVKKGNYKNKKTAMLCCGFGPFARS